MQGECIAYCNFAPSTQYLLSKKNRLGAGSVLDRSIVSPPRDKLPEELCLMNAHQYAVE